MNEYCKVRREIFQLVRDELIGPGSEMVGPTVENEIITDPPITRYSAGMLFPQQLTELIGEELEQDENCVTAKADIDETLDAHINLANQYKPSAMGISFFVKGICPSLKVNIKMARYVKFDKDSLGEVLIKTLSEDLKQNADFKKRITYIDDRIFYKGKMTPDDLHLLLDLNEDPGYKNAIYKLNDQTNRGWRRIPLEKEIIIPANNEVKFELNFLENEEIKLVCFKKPDYVKGITFITISLINSAVSTNLRDDENVYFQTKFSVQSVRNGERLVCRYIHKLKLTQDKELTNYELLYRKRSQFGVGHGCSVCWDNVEGDEAEKIYTEHMPIFETPKVGFDNDRINKELPEILRMKFLSDLSDEDPKKVIQGLFRFVDIYSDWIKDKENTLSTIEEDLKETANINLKECELAKERMRKGVELLQNDIQILKAFMLANRAMFMQRIHSGFNAKKNYPGEVPNEVYEIDYMNYTGIANWRPFQLAFFLLSLDSISTPESPERDLVDLIWFPTAGGKTEAYLGLSAFTIFLRRLRNKDKGIGTTIIMRYTLRLLTAQQFQRATTLTCACEIIRHEMENELGQEPITIGLWIGGESSPNTLDGAIYALNELISGKNDKNPFQILSCPWCGSKMVKDGRRGKWGYYKKDRPKRLVIECTDDRCVFHKNGLPVHVVDEEIYKNPPAILFSTVDKFALMPWKSEVSNLFGINNPDVLSPELIVQDELHLIAGPLGTIVGLYETLIDIFCSAKKIKPKIIASTATIRRANEQCRALYARNVKQFPPAGTSIEDSFFSQEIPISEYNPGRLYVGIMSSGKPQTTTIVRLVGAILQIVEEINCPDNIKDVYWTFVAYFNTLRELGTCVTLVKDDIKDYVRRMSQRRNTSDRKFYEPEELTSRINASYITEILERLQISYHEDKKHAIPILLASNMIATGVDITRFGLMAVIGQPKTTSEYIQATSRVGREYPGLVFTLYDGARPRDRSHYENFVSYHQAFYKYVEPTSVTPFSGPARDRALPAILISLIRHYFKLGKDEQIKDIIEKVDFDKIVSFVRMRVSKIDPKEEKETKDHLKGLIDDLKIKIEHEENLSYGVLTIPGSIQNHSAGKENILYPAGQQKPGSSLWPTLTSMRGVDVTCNIKIED